MPEMLAEGGSQAGAKAVSPLAGSLAVTGSPCLQLLMDIHCHAELSEHTEPGEEQKTIELERPLALAALALPGGRS
ncbi:hypothetical protein TURU_026417 [Turdus rufiventris]|nr:hypothetical protein TURU_026417 [Turdus rufiventris]